MSYRKLLENLEALPKKDRQLAGGVYLFRERGKLVCGCVLGKGVPEIAAAVRIDPNLNHLWIRGSEWASIRSAEPGGLTEHEMLVTQVVNDDFPHSAGKRNHAKTRRARYNHMIEWLRARVAEESGNAATAGPQEHSTSIRPSVWIGLILAGVGAWAAILWTLAALYGVAK